MATHDQTPTDFDDAAAQVVELGNRWLDADDEADAREIASGLLAGAIQFWCFSYQPCEDPSCEACADIRTAQQRLRKALEDVQQYAEESEYFHSPHDSNVGRA